MYYVRILLILSLFIGASHVDALTVSPVRIEVNGDPGTVLSGEIELFNEENVSRIFYASSENFEPRGDSGAPFFIGAKDGLATWIQKAPSVTIAPGERVVFPYTIAIPQNATPGGYFSAVFFGTQPPQVGEGGDISIGGKIGVLILLRVNGDIKEEAGIASFTVPKGKVHTTLPIGFEYRINNTGGDRIVPRGEMTIRNTFRMKVETLPVNETQGSVLPSSIRKFDVQWGEDGDAVGFWGVVKAQLDQFRFGWYTATLSVVWGESQQQGNATTHFFVIPWQLLTIIVGILVILLIVGRIVLRRYNTWIIQKALQQRTMQ